jgi:hypothetical protein
VHVQACHGMIFDLDIAPHISSHVVNHIDQDVLSG